MSTGGATERDNLFTHFTPGSHMVLFEGGKTGADQVEFKPYHGETRPFHAKRRLYEPVLKITSQEDARMLHRGTNEQILEKFNQQIDLINQTYNRDQHERIRVVARYGKHYYFGDPPKGNMSVNELHDLDKQTRQRTGTAFRAAFTPQDLPHDSMEAYLIREGYKLFDIENRFMVTIKAEGASTCLTVVLNENLEFIELRYPDVKWVTFYVKRVDSERRDVSFTLQSLREMHEESDPAVNRYNSAKILTVSGEDITITEEFMKEVEFVRRKTTRKFKKQGGEADGESRTEVHLVRSKKYIKPSGNGSFIDVKEWRDEEVIQPELPDIQDKEACSRVMDEFVKFCIFSDDAYLKPKPKTKQKGLISVFEGSTGGEHHVDFADYKGECQPGDNKCSLYEAVLKNPSREAAEDIKDGSNEQIKTIFLQFTKKMNKREDDSQVMLEVRFGKIYYFIKPDEVTNSAELSNLDVDAVVSKFTSAFQPLHMSHEAVEGFLQEQGYRLTSTETEFSLSTVKIGVERIKLNEQLEVVEVIPKDKTLLKFNIKRMDPKKRDYRFVLSERKIITSIPEKYKRKMVRREGDDNLIVTKDFIDKVQMIRQKTTQKYSKDRMEDDVRLEKVKEHFKPNRYGRFTRVKPWREEVVIKYKVPETGTDSDYASLIQEGMKLSYKLENFTYQELYQLDTAAEDGQLEFDSGTDEDKDEFDQFDKFEEFEESWYRRQHHRKRDKFSNHHGKWDKFETFYSEDGQI